MIISRKDLEALSSSFCSQEENTSSDADEDKVPFTITHIFD